MMKSMRQAHAETVTHTAVAVARWLFIGLLLCFAAIVKNAHAQVAVPTAGIIDTIAGNGVWGYSGSSGTAIKMALKNPTGVAVDSAGNLYIADTINGRIWKVSAATGSMTSIAGAGLFINLDPNDGDGGAATNAFLNVPTDIAIDTAGNLYIADTQNNRIRKVTASTGIISTVAGGESAGDSGDGYLATTAKLNQPNGVAVDGSGNIYIADTTNNRVRKVNAATGIITTVAGNGIAGYTDNRAATSAELNGPYGLAVDGSGNVYICDAKNNVVRKVTAATGVISTVAGNGVQGYSGDNGAAVNAELYNPAGIAINAAGNLYISDTYNHVVRKITTSSGVISAVAGTNAAGYAGDHGVATSAKTNSPTGVATDIAGNLYFADTLNNVVRVVGVPPLTLGTVTPIYQPLSIIYTPPGNASSSGLTNTASKGASLNINGSIRGDLTGHLNVMFSTGPAGGGGAVVTNLGGAAVGASLGVTGTINASDTLTETFSEAASISNQRNGGADAIDHNQDLFLIWLNPSISVWYQDLVPVWYEIGVLGSVGPDIVEVFANTMKPNIWGHTTVPAALLNQQFNPATGVKTPGLAAICKGLIAAKYTAGTCTLGDQCGCTASDFAPILALDPIINYSGAKNPLDANIASATTCGKLPTTASSGNCRYVPVPAAPGSTIQAVQTLVGPETEGGNRSCNGFNQSDNISNAIMLGGSVGVPVGVSGGASLASASGMLTFTLGMSVGTQYGLVNQQNMTLCSSNTGLYQNVAVYEDTVFHTFVFQQPQTKGVSAAPDDVMTQFAKPLSRGD